MEFRPHCPKCGSHDIHTEGARGGGWGDSGIVLICRCGKRVYGRAAIEGMVNVQKKEWKKASPERSAAAEAARLKREESARIAAKAEAARLHRIKETRRQQAEAAEAKRLETLAWMQRKREEAKAKARLEKAKQAHTSSPEPEPSTPPTPSAEVCAWKDCDEPSTGSSKYCCLEHRRKNARWRYEARRKA